MELHVTDRHGHREGHLFNSFLVQRSGWKVDPAASRQVAGAANILSAWKSARGARGVPGPVPARGPSPPVRVQAAPSPPGPRAHVLGGRTRSARWSAGLAGGP